MQHHVHVLGLRDAGMSAAPPTDTLQLIGHPPSPASTRPSAAGKQAHFPYAAAVLKESMRLYAPSITLMREAPARSEWQLGGYEVPPGTALQVGWWRVGVCKLQLQVAGRLHCCGYARQPGIRCRFDRRLTRND